ncbi:MAG: GNAT family N-acetyltransferase [Promethearchaeota archaeon]
MLEEVRKKLYDKLTHPDENIVIGAFYKDKLIGLIYLHRKLMNERIKHIGKWGIIVHPDFHNQGIGTIILKTLENGAIQIGLIKLEASFQSRNHVAKHVYLDKLHYKVGGIKRLAILLDNGTFNDEILISKLLNSKSD